MSPSLDGPALPGTSGDYGRASRVRSLPPPRTSPPPPARRASAPPPAAARCDKRHGVRRSGGLYRHYGRRTWTTPPTRGNHGRTTPSRPPSQGAPPRCRPRRNCAAGRCCYPTTATAAYGLPWIGGPKPVCRGERSSQPRPAGLPQAVSSPGRGHASGSRYVTLDTLRTNGQKGRCDVVSNRSNGTFRNQTSRYKNRAGVF